MRYVKTATCITGTGITGITGTGLQGLQGQDTHCMISAARCRQTSRNPRTPTKRHRAMRMRISACRQGRGPANCPKTTCRNAAVDAGIALSRRSGRDAGRSKPRHPFADCGDILPNPERGRTDARSASSMTRRVDRTRRAAGQAKPETGACELWPPDAARAGAPGIAARPGGRRPAKRGSTAGGPHSFLRSPR